MPLRLPVWFGNAVLVFGTLVGAGAVAFALTTESGGARRVRADLRGPPLVRDVPPPAHWLVGRAMGIRFLAYYVRDLIPPVPD